MRQPIPISHVGTWKLIPISYARTWQLIPNLLCRNMAIDPFNTPQSQSQVYSQHHTIKK